MSSNTTPVYKKPPFSKGDGAGFRREEGESRQERGSDGIRVDPNYERSKPHLHTVSKSIRYVGPTQTHHDSEKVR